MVQSKAPVSIPGKVLYLISAQGSANGGPTAVALLPLSHPKTESRKSSRDGCRERLQLFSSAGRWEKTSAKAHHARVPALATAGDIAETLPTSLKPATGRSADRKGTLNTAITATSAKGEKWFMNYLMRVRS